MNGERPVSREEEDLRERSTKKVKGGEHTFTNDSTVPINYADIYEDTEKEASVRWSYKETFLGVSDGDHEKESEGIVRLNVGVDGSESDKTMGVLGDMKLQIIEKKNAEYDCPEIVIPPRAEERLARPWK